MAWFTGNKKRVTDSETYWRGHHRRWERSGMTQSEYCRQEGVSLSSFTNWRSKLARGTSGSTGFVEVSPREVPGNEDVFLELVIPGAGTLRIPVTLSPERLRMILAAVKAVN